MFCLHFILLFVSQIKIYIIKCPSGKIIVIDNFICEDSMNQLLSPNQCQDHAVISPEKS